MPPTPPDHIGWTLWRAAQVWRAEFTAANPTRFSVIVRSYYRTPEFRPPPAPPAESSRPDNTRTAAAPSAKPALPAVTRSPAKARTTPAPQVDGQSAKTGVLRQVLEEPEPADAATRKPNR